MCASYGVQATMKPRFIVRVLLNATVTKDELWVTLFDAAYLYSLWKEEKQDIIYNDAANPGKEDTCSMHRLLCEGLGGVACLTIRFARARRCRWITISSIYTSSWSTRLQPPAPSTLLWTLTADYPGQSTLLSTLISAYPSARPSTVSASCSDSGAIVTFASSDSEDVKGVREVRGRPGCEACEHRLRLPHRPQPTATRC